MTRTRPALLAALLLLGASGASADEVSLNALTEEVQRISEDQDRIGMAWWIPVEYWEVSLSQGTAPSTPDQIAAFTSVLRDYTLFAVVDGIVGQFGGVTWIPKEDVRETIKLQDAGGTWYVPLPEAQVSPDARNLTAAMKPVFGNMLGPMGEHMDFFFFPARTPEGKPIADARGNGTFRFQLAKDVYEWRLPLGSLLPAKVCPVDREKMSGAWTYCPFHGKKLKEP